MRLTLSIYLGDIPFLFRRIETYQVDAAKKAAIASDRSYTSAQYYATKTVVPFEPIAEKSVTYSSINLQDPKIDDDDDAQETKYYSYILNQVNKLLSEANRNRIHCTHKTNIIFSSSPDFSMFMHDVNKLDKYSRSSKLLSFLEFKKVKLTSSHKGQSLAYSDLILDAQPHRAYVVSCLFNLNHFIIFKIIRNFHDNSRTYLESSEYDFSTHASIFKSFLNSEPEFFGYITHICMNKIKISVPECLGYGASALIFAHSNKQSVFKKFFVTCIEDYRNEVSILKHLNGTYQDFPVKLLGHDDSELIIHIEPYGFHFHTLNIGMQACHMIDAIKFIKRMHDAQVLHHDIRPSNFLIKKDKVFLVDYAFSINLNLQRLRSTSKEAFQGNYHYASFKILNEYHKAQESYDESDDYCSLIRTFMALSVFGLRNRLVDRVALSNGNLDETCSNLQDFWTSEFKRYPFWKDMESYAVKADTIGMEKLLKDYEKLGM